MRGRTAAVVVVVVTGGLGAALVAPGAGAWAQEEVTLGVAEPEGRLAAEGARAGYEIERRRDGLGWEYRGPRFVAYIALDGTVGFDDREVSFGPGGAVWFDVTDYYLRSRGDDPYAAQKAEFLAATHSARLALAAGYQQDAIAGALANLPGYLQWIWESPALSTAEKRAVLAQLAAETSDTPAGRRARLIIERFSASRDQ